MNNTRLLRGMLMLLFVFVYTGAVPDSVHVAEVQQSLSKIQAMLLQLKWFWENIGVMVTNLQQRTFAGEDLIEFLSDFKDDFLGYC